MAGAASLALISPSQSHSHSMSSHTLSLPLNLKIETMELIPQNTYTSPLTGALVIQCFTVGDESLLHAEPSSMSLTAEPLISPN